MNILVITSCTGEKRANFPHQLTWSDFQAGPEHIAKREHEHPEMLISAEELYTGQQHLRLMQAVKLIRSGGNNQLDLFILSAGYGLIPSTQKILPYEATFNDLGAAELQDWSVKLDIPNQFRSLLSHEKYDLCLCLLGEKYWLACNLDVPAKAAFKVLAFGNTQVEAKLADWENFYPISLANKDGKRFRCNLISLKGELAARLLHGLEKGSIKKEQVLSGGEDLLEELEKENLSLPVPLEDTLKFPLPYIDQVIELPDSWKNSPHRSKLRYFIPEWDDLVDPDYDFFNDTHSCGTADWANEKYAHQFYKQPSYDGILVSKITVDQQAKKQARMQELGVHRQLRVPETFQVMGDCGAFGYVNMEKPPFSTSEILDYYSNYGFNLGVSIDHIIIGKDLQQIRNRYEMTMQYAEEFLAEHRKRGLDWTPIGAVQGWDPDSYAKAALQYVKMGYQYIGIGGLVRRNTKELMQVVEAVTTVVPKNIRIHLFGIARLNVLRLFQQMGVTSVDSASYLRKAWMGQKDNYYSLDGQHYAAIRVPEVEKSVRAKKAIRERNIPFEQLKKLEVDTLAAVRAYDKGNSSLETVLNLLEEYEFQLDDTRKSMRPHYQRTLEVKPWKQCPCEICQTNGIEVILFRNNNRNRRRGFHNTYVFYELLKQTIEDPTFYINQEHRLFEETYFKEKKQLSVF